MKKKWDRASMRFKSAGYLSRRGMLDVTFENDDHFLIATESLLLPANSVPVGRNGSQAARLSKSLAAPDWSKMRIGETGDVLEVPAVGTVIEIPWDRIRSLADAEFRAHLSDRADERAHRIGERVRAMRLEAGLTQAALAKKVGVRRELVASLESGKIEPRIDLLEQVIVALGMPWSEFAKE